MVRRYKIWFRRRCRYSKDKEAYSYLNKSVKDFIWGEEMKQRLERAGFRDVRYNALTFGITTIYTAKK